MSKSSFNIIYKDNKNILPEIEDIDLLHFGLYFMKIYEREIQKSEPNFKILNI